MTKTTLILSINRPQLKQSVYADFTITDGVANQPDIFVMLGLEKRAYLKLLQIYHPDVYDGCKQLATEVSQHINAAKDGRRAASNNASSYSNSSSNGYSQSAWDDFMNEFYRRYGERRERSDQQPEWETTKLNNWLSRVPAECWQYYGGRNAFTVSAQSLHHIEYIKAKQRLALSYITIEVEITIHKDNIHVSENVQTLSRSALLSFHHIDWMKLKKDDLQQILTHEGLKWYKSWSKARLVASLCIHVSTLNIDNINDIQWAIQPYYGLLSAWDLIVDRQNPNYKFGFQDTPEEVARKTAARHEEEQRKYGPYHSATEWLRNTGKPYLGRELFIEYVRAAEEVAMEWKVRGKPHGQYTAYPCNVWSIAYNRVT